MSNDDSGDPNGMELPIECVFEAGREAPKGRTEHVGVGYNSSVQSSAESTQKDHNLVALVPVNACDRNKKGAAMRALTKLKKLSPRSLLHKRSKDNNEKTTSKESAMVLSTEKRIPTVENPSAAKTLSPTKTFDDADTIATGLSKQTIATRQEKERGKDEAKPERHQKGERRFLSMLNSFKRVPSRPIDEVNHEMQRQKDTEKGGDVQQEDKDTPPTTKPTMAIKKDVPRTKQPTPRTAIKRTIELLTTEDGIDHRLPMNHPLSIRQDIYQETKEADEGNENDAPMTEPTIELSSTKTGIGHRTPFTLVKSMSSFSRASQGSRKGEDGRSSTLHCAKTTNSPPKSPKGSPSTLAPVLTKSRGSSTRSPGLVKDDKSAVSEASKNSKRSVGTTGSQSTYSAHECTPSDESTGSYSTIWSRTNSASSMGSFSAGSSFSTGTYSAFSRSTISTASTLSGSTGSQPSYLESLGEQDDMSDDSLAMTTLTDDQSLRTQFRKALMEAQKDPWTMVSTLVRETSTDAKKMVARKVLHRPK